MSTTTDKLAEALRTILDNVDPVVYDPHSGEAVGEDADLRKVHSAAQRVLAEYDAERVTERDPDTDAFLGAAAAAHDADYYQIVDDVPIDRVDDGAWVTIRAFVMNADAGVSGPEDDEDD